MASVSALLLMLVPILGAIKFLRARLAHLTSTLPTSALVIVSVTLERVPSREFTPAGGTHRAYTPVADKYMLSHALSREGLGAAGLVALHPVRSRTGRRVRFRHRKFALPPLLDFA